MNRPQLLGGRPMKSTILRWALALCCFVLFLPVAQAQYRAGLQGTVLDAQGGVAEGATVALTNLDTNHAKQATTSSSGVFDFPSLPPGQYTVTVAKTGFKKKVL